MLLRIAHLLPHAALDNLQGVLRGPSAPQNKNEGTNPFQAKHIPLMQLVE
jgi:hypothetical protein